MSVVDLQPLYYRKALLGTPPVLLLPYAWVEMIEHGTIDEFTIPGNDYHEVVWTEDLAGKPTSFITFRELTNEMWICLSYTRRADRQKGLHKRLYQHVENLSIERGLRRLSSGIWASNLTMQATARASGREPYGMLWKKDLNQPKDE